MTLKELALRRNDLWTLRKNYAFEILEKLNGFFSQTNILRKFRTAVDSSIQ